MGRHPLTGLCSIPYHPNPEQPNTTNPSTRRANYHGTKKAALSPKRFLKHFLCGVRANLGGKNQTRPINPGTKPRPPILAQRMPADAAFQLQALLAASLGVEYVAPYLGRMTDKGKECWGRGWRRPPHVAGGSSLVPHLLEFPGVLQRQLLVCRLSVAFLRCCLLKRCKSISSTEQGES